MFQIRLPENISKAGWHVAHIFDVNNGDVHFHSWDLKELMRRTARNIHPCNYFFVPKRDWRLHGGNRSVIAFFYAKFKSRYGAIWEDFLELVDGNPQLFSVRASKYKYAYSGNQDKKGLRTKVEGVSGGSTTRCPYSRFCFKADVIEPLGMDDSFCIETKEGTFVMTKAEFYKTFPKVLETKSYKQAKVYHYPKPPKRAWQFKIDKMPFRMGGAMEKISENLEALLGKSRESILKGKRLSSDEFGRALSAREAARCLAQAGATEKQLKPVRRRRSAKAD